MKRSDYFNDSPISVPEEDRFGIDPFARALAASITQIKSPVGATIALNGPWGSGKSSAVNLIRHHLNPGNSEDLVIVEFKCWWFRGEEALTLAFLQTLKGALDIGLDERAKELLGKIGKDLLQAGPVVGPALNLATGGVWGTLVSLITGSMDFTKRYFSDSQSIETAFNKLSALLAGQSKRFVVVIDDIDRLAPEEAVQVFRLIKSVGRLPNVIYLVVFDRELAEKAVAQRYPSEGPHFLEKIIQANFELPLPARDDINNAFLAEVETRCGSLSDSEALLHFMNLFYDVVAPCLSSPRDLTRLTNSIAVSWPPVSGEVNLGDFIALEAIRVFDGPLFSAIRNSKTRVCGTEPQYGGRDNEREKTLQELLKKIPEARKEVATTALKRLFPRLENIGYGEGFKERWEAERRVCSEKHFDTYFRMAVGDETLRAEELEKLIKNAGSPDYIKTTLKEAVTSVRKNNKSRVPLLLDEMNVHSGKIQKEQFTPLLTSLFEIADDIDREGDKERGFSFGDNHLRIHWLVRKLTFERCTLEERTEIFKKACPQAQVGWLVDFSNSAVTDYFPREGRQPEPPEKCLVEKDYLDELKRLTLTRLQQSASQRLVEHPRLPYLMFRWRDLSSDDGKEVKAWSNAQLDNDVSVALLAKAFTQETWSQGMGMVGLGDRVAMRKLRASIEGLDKIMDVEKFKRRLNDLASRNNLDEPYKGYIATFLDALSKKERGEED